MSAENPEETTLIPLKRRTAEQYRSYIQGYRAGVRACRDTIAESKSVQQAIEKLDRFRELLRSEAADVNAQRGEG